jgi:hypothetical protein
MRVDFDDIAAKRTGTSIMGFNRKEDPGCRRLEGFNLLWSRTPADDQAQPRQHGKHSHRLIGKTRRNEDTLSVDISTSSSWEIAGHNEDKPSDQRLWPLSPIATIQKLQEFLR